MVVHAGSSTPGRFGNTASVPTFPRSAATWTDPTGSIIIPGGALDSWWAYRNTLGAVRGDVICYGDSTMFGSASIGYYSLLQRLRDRATGYSTGGPAGFGMIDGGKGIIANAEYLLTYDAPEINGFVSTTFSAGIDDGYEVLDGQFWYSNTGGEQLVLQFKTTCARLYYSFRNNAGQFTYSIDGGAPVTVNAHNPSGDTYTITSPFVYISGLAPNATHTITITNLATGGGTACYIALAPIQANGIVFQKFATSGDVLTNRFWLAGATSPDFLDQTYGFRFQQTFGRVPTVFTPPQYTGTVLDTSQPAGGEMNPVLAICSLGYNDIGTAPTKTPQMWTEYVKRFAGICQDAGCPGVVCSGQMPYSSNWPTYGPAIFTAQRSQALASGLPFVDLFYPVAGPSLSYTGGTVGPHLSKAQYQAQADFLWDNLLGLKT